MSEPAWRRYARLIRPRTAEDVDAELALHLELRVQEYMARGMSEADARAATLKRLGDLAAARRDCITITSKREQRMLRVQLWDAFVQDIRFAFRTLGRQKGWTAAGVLTLALGIGATTAVFSTVSSLLLHPLSYPDTRRLAFVFQRPSTGNNTGVSIQITPSPHTYRAWKDGTHAFEAMQAWATTDVILQQNGTARRLHAADIEASLPRFTGVQPLMGRGPVAEDGPNHLVAISEALWRSAFNADTGILRRTLTLDGQVYQVAGVMPSAFQLPALIQQQTDIWRPLDLTRTDIGLNVMGRKRPGVTEADAERDLDSALTRASSQDGGGAFRTVVVPPRSLVHFEETLRLLTAAVALVLLIACANVAHLLLARGAARQHELAVRAALGAGTGRLRRQLLTESLVLALAGCVGGILIGRLGLAAIQSLRPPSLSQLDLAHLDGTTLVVTIVLALLSGLGFGVVGASQSAQLARADGLRSGSRGSSGGRSHNRLRSLLVVAEMALSTALLVGAALLVRGMLALQSVDPGFKSEGLYAVAPQLPKATYPDIPATTRYFEALATRARAIPGVDAVTIAAGAPPSMSFMIGSLQLEGEEPPAAGSSSFVQFNGITPDYFQVLGIRIVQGSTFTDTSDAAAQVIINEGMARARWPGQSPLGKRLRVVFGGGGAWKTVVGVAANASTGGLLMENSTPLLYVPTTSNYSPAAILRISRPEVALPALRRILADLDPRIPAPDIKNVGAEMAQSIAGPRFTMTLIASFSVLAIVLAAVGLYGLVSYAVTQRTREIGIRIALGASRRRIAGSVLGRAFVLGVVGLAVGLVTARLGTRLIASQLAGIPATDPVAFTAAAVLLLLTVLAACLMPMVRAMSVSPQIAMRAE